jgi:hypothetical protein
MRGMRTDLNMHSGGVFLVTFFDPDTLRCSGQALKQERNKVNLS